MKQVLIIASLIVSGCATTIPPHVHKTKVVEIYEMDVRYDSEIGKRIVEDFEACWSEELSSEGDKLYCKGYLK